MFLPNLNRTEAAESRKCRLLYLVNLTFDIDLQTRLSEGPNTGFQLSANEAQQ